MREILQEIYLIEVSLIPFTHEEKVDYQGGTEEKVFIAKRPAVRDILIKILRVLSAEEYLTSTDVSMRVGISRKTARKYLDLLVELGDLMKRRGVPIRVRIGRTDVYVKVPITKAKKRRK